MTEHGANEPQERQKRTVWLLAGGAASLVLPLLGVAYLHWSEGAAASAPSGRADLFERRDGGDRRIVPSQAVSSLPPPVSLPIGKIEKSAGSSLDFIKTGEDMKAKPVETAAKPAAASPVTAPAVSTAPAAAAKSAGKTAKKPFVMPKLQGSNSFTNFNTGKSGGSAPNGAPGGQNVQDALKNLPPEAANNPQLQQYLKSQGQ